MKRLISFFEKSVDVHIDYVYTKGKKLPDTFNIYVIHKNKCNMLTNLEWDEIERVINVLEEENKPIQLWREFGMGKEVLYVPRWARNKLANKLKEVKRKEDERIRRESEPQSFTFKELVNSDEKPNLLGCPLLISGIAGSGRTFAIKEMLKELAKENHRVAVVDFRNEYSDVIEELEGVSLTSDEAHNIKDMLVRIYFEGDVLLDKSKKYDFNFLTKLANKFDYLIIDDAQALYQDHFNLNSASSIYEVCASLIKQNLNLKIFLSVQSLSSLTQEDRESLQELFSHHLHFRQVPSLELDNCTKLYSLQVGEALFFKNKKVKNYISFKTKRDGNP